MLKRNLLVLTSCFGFLFTEGQSKIADANVRSKKTAKEEQIQSKDDSYFNFIEIFLNDCPDFLKTAFYCALKNNPDIQISLLKLKMMQYDKKINNANYLPKVYANGGYKGDNNGAGQLFKSENFGAYFGGEVSWNIFNSGSTFAATKELNIKEAEVLLELQVKISEVLNQIADLYFSISAKKQEIEYIEQLIVHRASHIKTAQIKYKAGLVKFLEVTQAEAARLETLARLQKVKTEYINFNAKFEEISGIKYEESKEQLKVSNEFFNILPEKALEYSIKNNIKKQIASKRQAEAQAAIGKNNDKWGPSVEISAGYQFTPKKTDNSKNKNQNQKKNDEKEQAAANKNHDSKNNWSAGIKVAQPIFVGGAYAERQKLQKLALAAALEYAKICMIIKTEIYTFCENIKAAQLGHSSSLEAVSHHNKAIKNIQTEIKIGLKSGKDLVDEQVKFIEAKIEATKYQKEMYSSAFKIIEILGFQITKTIIETAKITKEKERQAKPKACLNQTDEVKKVKTINNTAKLKCTKVKKK